MSSEWQCSDTELVERIISGEEDAFTLLVKRFHRPVYAIAYRMVGNVTEAEDLSQEIFLRIYQNLSRYDRSLPLAPWIYRIACNQTLNRLKRRALATTSLHIIIDGEESERPIADSREDPEQAMITRSREERLQQALLTLPENYRLAFTLKYLEDLTAEEIGEIMQVPRNTIKTWLFRAREALRSRLTDEL
ncbi:MAG: sigma-70 family RNA polymerase sigma factor [Acidobacteriota bacterium]